MTRVLVVDDDAGIRSIVAELLEDEGCTVGTAGDGLKHSNAPRKAPPAAILLDLMMPVLDAWDLSRRAGSEAFAWVYR